MSWFWHYDSQFTYIEPVSRHLDTFGPIWFFFVFLQKSSVSSSQLFCRIDRNFNVLKFAIKWVDFIHVGILILNLDLFNEFPRHLNAFGPIWKFRISAEELSQLFCKIRRKFNTLIYANKGVDLVGFVIMILNLDLFDEFHGI